MRSNVAESASTPEAGRGHGGPELTLVEPNALELDPAVGTDDIEPRNVVGGKQSENLPFLVGQQREGEAKLCRERPELVRSLLAADREDDEPASAECLPEFLFDVGQLGVARAAPGGEQREDDNLALQLIESKRLSGDRGSRKGGREVASLRQGGLGNLFLLAGGRGCERGGQEGDGKEKQTLEIHRRWD